MRIYGRTLLFFIGAIVFQALLTAGLIIGLVSRNNQTVTRAELHEESALVYANYNEWVRRLWRTAIAIAEDENVSRFSTPSGDWADNRRLLDSLEAALHGSGVDSFVVRNGGREQFEILTDAYPYIDDFRPFAMDRGHPYIALKAVEGYVFLTASVALGPETEVFLLKHIDDDFYELLKSRDHTRVFVSSDMQNIWKAVGDGGDHSDILALDEAFPPRREFYDVNFGRGHYNVSTQNLGHMEGDGELKLLVFMSIEPYFSLLFRIGRIVLLVSLVTAVITAVAALLFTGRLTRPIQDLARATRDVREGNLEVSVPGDAMGEMRQAMEGFNSMVRHLNENRVTLDANLREITFLKEYNETIIHSLQAGILVVNDSLIVEKANGFYRDAFVADGIEPEGLSLKELASDVLDKEVRNRAAALFTGSTEPWADMRRSGESVWEVKIYLLNKSDPASGCRCVIEIDDISAKMELEQKILQAEKLSSLSLLSAGIAHEINNPLSTILANAQILLSRAGDGIEKDSLEWIERETRRIADIVRDLRNFSHSGENEESFHDVNGCAEEVVRLIRYGVPENSGVVLELRPHPGAPEIAMARDEFRLILMNLLQNAVQALDGSGRIDLEISDRDADNVRVVVRDTGAGIPEPVRSRIFDPFFTTKDDGVGTGLGLSIVYGIVRKFGGNIDVRSGEGRGTEFTLTLPKRKDTV